MGKKYLLTKALIQSSTALNLAMFLLLKSEEASADNDNDNDSSLMDTASSSLVQFHPVMKRLQEWNVLDQKLKSKVEDTVDGLEDQLENLIKASKLMESMAANPDDESGNAGEENGDDDENAVGEENASGEAAAAEDASSSSDSESSVDEEALTKAAAQNARFGLRPNEVAQDKSGATRKRQRRAAPSDLGDDEDAGADNKGAARYLSSALNTIEQRAASKKKKRVVSSEELVEHKEVDDDLRRGLEMMEAELGKASDEENDAGTMQEEDIESGEHGDDGFYSKMTKKSKAKKAFKKTLYKVAPKYPRMEAEVEGTCMDWILYPYAFFHRMLLTCSFASIFATGERAISRTIMKNRGLVAHKNKLNRNPRVKKREQYRKALIKRKGTVREVRTEEGHRYGGEETGIKRGISRSRRLGTN